MRVGANAVDKDQLGKVATDTNFTKGELDDLFLFAKTPVARFYWA